MINENHIHEGHRSRMKSKLVRHGSEIFDTYELLEMLLYYAVPYKDTNPIAKLLLDKFGTLDGVLSADREELMSVKGVGEKAADFLLTVGASPDILGAKLSETMCESFKVYSKAGQYFVHLFSEHKGHRVALMLLDNKMRCIDCELLYSLDYDSGEVKPKMFIDKAMRLHASVAITAHSHPYGPLFPSEGDRATNLLISGALKSMGVTHAEHFVVSGDKYIGIMNNGWQGVASVKDVDDFYRSKYDQIALGIVEDPAKYIPDYDS